MQTQEIIEAKDTPSVSATETLPEGRALANIRETETDYRIDLLVPGVSIDGVELTVEKNVLNLRANSRVSFPEGLELLHNELNPVSYAREFRLPDDADVDAISAKLELGVLALSLPKRKAPTAKTIPITE